MAKKKRKNDADVASTSTPAQAAVENSGQPAQEEAAADSAMQSGAPSAGLAPEFQQQLEAIVAAMLAKQQHQQPPSTAAPSTSSPAPSMAAPSTGDPLSRAALEEEIATLRSQLDAAHLNTNNVVEVARLVGEPGVPAVVHASSARLELKAVDKSLKWAGFHDKRKPALFLQQLADQQSAARALNDADKWHVARYLMDTAPYELLINHFPSTLACPPFNAFTDWFLTTYETKSLTARNWELLQALTQAVAANESTAATLNQLVADFEAFVARLVGFELPDLMKIYLMHLRLPNWVHKSTIVDPVSKDMFSSWPAYRRNLLAFAASMRTAPTPKPEVKPYARAPARMRGGPAPKPYPKVNALNMKRRADRPPPQPLAAQPSTSTPFRHRDEKAFLMWYKNKKVHKWFCFTCKSDECRDHNGCKTYQPLPAPMQRAYDLEWPAAKDAWYDEQRAARASQPK